MSNTVEAVRPSIVVEMNQALAHTLIKASLPGLEFIRAQCQKTLNGDFDNEPRKTHATMDVGGTDMKVSLKQRDNLDKLIVKINAILKGEA